MTVLLFSDEAYGLLAVSAGRTGLTVLLPSDGAYGLFVTLAGNTGSAETALALVLFRGDIGTPAGLELNGIALNCLLLWVEDTIPAPPVVNWLTPVPAGA